MTSALVLDRAERNPAAAIVGAGALTLLTLGLLAAFHVGFQASDDASYLAGALGWLEHFPYVGNSHWTLRHTITLPTALAIRLFGLNEAAVSLANIAYYLGFLAVNAWFMWRTFGGLAAGLATLLMVVLPGFTVVATYLNSDVPELFYVCCAFWIVVAARQRPDRRWPWLAAGVLLGCGFVTRQTTLAAVAFFGLQFLFAPRAPRGRYLLMGMAFAAVLLVDWLYLTAMTGNALYRFNVDFNHDRVDRAAEAARVAAAGGLIDKEGNLSVNVYVDPLLALLASQKYALLFWLALPGSVAAWRDRGSRQGRVLMLALGLAAVWFVFVAANPKLYLVPRYLLVVAWCAAVVAGVWLAGLWHTGRRRTMMVLTAVGVATAVAALSVENIDPRFVERQLVRWVEQHPDRAVHTDLETAIRSRYYFRFAGIPDPSVSTERPGPGSVVLYSPERVQQCAAMPRCRERADDFKPTAEWLRQASFEAPPRPIGRWLRAIGLEHAIPADIARRLFAPGGRVAIYEVKR